MRSALHFLDAEIARVVESGLALRFDEGEFIQNRIAITRFVQKQLRSRVESNQEILVRVVAGLNKLRQSVACALHFIAAHRTRNIENHSDGHGRVIVAEVSNLLLLFVVENGECVLAQSGYVTSIGIGDSYGQCDQVSVSD